MKRIWILLALALTACTATVSGSDSESNVPKSLSAMFTSNLSDLGPAPEFVNDVWLNTDKPLRLADLRGKVVAVDMWTFG